VKAAFGVGKTWVAGALVNWWFDTNDDAVIATTAPTGRQVRDLLWKEIRTQRRTEPVCDVTQLRDPVRPDHYAIGFTAGKDKRVDEFGSQSAQGLHSPHLLFVMDEGAGVRPEIWASMEDIAVGTDNRVLAIGNPTVTGGPFYEAAKSGRWHVITITALEHPNIVAGLQGRREEYPGAVSLAWLEDKLADPRWVDKMGTPTDEAEREAWLKAGYFEFREVWYRPGPIAEAKILGRFPTTLTDTVWALAWLEAARSRELKWRENDPLELGMDVARYGDDSTTLHMRRGPCALRHTRWSKAANTASAGRVKVQLQAELDTGKHDNLPAIIIRVDTTGGHGGGVADMLRQELRAVSERIQIVDVSASESARDGRRYPNRRSELWFEVADRGMRGDLDLTRMGQTEYDDLITQLLAPRFAYDSGGRRVVEKKDETKSRIGRSPDDADGFNLAWAGGDAGALQDAPELRKPSRWAAERTVEWAGGRSGRGRWGGVT